METFTEEARPLAIKTLAEHHYAGQGSVHDGVSITCSCKDRIEVKYPENMETHESLWPAAYLAFSAHGISKVEEALSELQTAA